MMRQQWRGTDLVVQLDGLPVRNLSKDDNAVQVRYLNARAETPRNDLGGTHGVHVINVETNIEVILLVPLGATETLAFLQPYFETRQQIRALTGRNLGSDTSGFVANDVVLQDSGPWGGGQNPTQYQFTFIGIRGRIIYGGQRILP